MYSVALVAATPYSPKHHMYKSIVLYKMKCADSNFATQFPDINQTRLCIQYYKLVGYLMPDTLFIQ